MKKVIWIFGESATGKLKLINDIVANENNIKLYLGLENEKIDIIKRTIESNLSSFDDKDNEEYRKKTIMKGIETFINNDSTILLIKGQSNDMNDKYGNTLKEFANAYPDLDKEIYLLEVDNIDLHYNRFINKDWFKKDEERYKKIFTKEWLPAAIENHRQVVYSYEKYGFTITDIDSTNGFVIKKSKDMKENNLKRS